MYLPLPNCIKHNGDDAAKETIKHTAITTKNREGPCHYGYAYHVWVLGSKEYSLLLRTDVEVLSDAKPPYT